MKRFIYLFIILCCCILQAEERENPFLSYIRQVEFLEKQLADASENQKPGIRKRLEDIKKQKDQAVAKRKDPYVRELDNLKKYLAEAKSDSKKKSLQNRINQVQGEINRLDAYARGASKYDVDKKEIDQDQKKPSVE